MPANTPSRLYPYPLPADPTNVPADIQALAEAVNDDVEGNLAPVTPMPRVWGHMRSSGTQVIQPNIETSLSFQIQFNDTDNMVNTVTSPTVMTINTAGFYAFHVLVTAPVTNWTNLVLRMRLNSTTEVFVCDQEFSSGAQPRFEITASWMRAMLVGQTMNVTLQHNGSGPLSVPAREFMGVRMAA